MHPRTSLSLALSLFIGICISLPNTLEASQSRADESRVHGALVLIPGTFNSITPGSALPSEARRALDVNPYFSADILRALREAGYRTLVIRKLQPFGDYEANGDAAARQIQRWYEKEFPAGDIPLTVIGHSAGSFYGLYSLQKLRNIPVKKFFALASPLQGMELAEQTLERTWLGRQLQRLLDGTRGVIDLRGLAHLSPLRVREYLSRLRLPTGIEVITVPGAQPLPTRRDRPRDSRVLSTWMAITGRRIGTESDGIISVISSLGVDARLTDERGERVPVRHAGLRMNLEHAEQVVDYRIFRALGARETGFIRDEQIRVFSELARLAAE